MNALDIVLAHLPSAKKCGEGKYRARCPAHQGSKLSLSVRYEQETVLLHCFVGCTRNAVRTALGLQARDLFDNPKKNAPSPQRPQALTEQDIENALEAHLQRVLNEEAARIGYMPPTTSRHHNAARKAVSRILGVTIPPAEPKWWECPPHDDDPLWPVFAARTLQEISEWERGHDTPTQEDRNDALDRAAEWLHHEAQRGTTHTTITLRAA